MARLAGLPEKIVLRAAAMSRTKELTAPSGAEAPAVPGDDMEVDGGEAGGAAAADGGDGAEAARKVLAEAVAAVRAALACGVQESELPALLERARQASLAAVKAC